MKLIRYLHVIVLLLFAPSCFAIQIQSPNFESAEHSAVGDQVRLAYAKNESSKENAMLSLENGFSLSYGNILTLADFYGDSSAPISKGADLKERMKRFSSTFATINSKEANLGELKKIFAVLAREQALIADGILHGETAEAVYRRINSDLDREYNCAMGGNCSLMWFLFPSKYLTLKSDDRDHFGTDAWLSYEAGHKVALQEAIAAHSTQDKARLMKAYAMNAFASHYLTDYFAAGHIRTPRVALPEQVTPSIIGALLSKYMHDEENAYGLSVHNQRGNTWNAYGDGYLHAKQHQAAVRIIVDALQASVDEIFNAYLTGQLPARTIVEDYLPIANEDNGYSQHDITPLFYWDKQSKVLYRRTDVSNPYDKRMTADWWGWTTAIMLVQQRGLSVAWQANIAVSGYGKLGIQYGLITDKNVIKYVNERG